MHLSVHKWGCGVEGVEQRGQCSVEEGCGGEGVWCRGGGVV